MSFSLNAIYNPNLFRISEYLEISKFEFSRFYCILDNYSVTITMPSLFWLEKVLI